jgi:hypothetical protein
MQEMVVSSQNLKQQTNAFLRLTLFGAWSSMILYNIYGSLTVGIILFEEGKLRSVSGGSDLIVALFGHVRIGGCCFPFLVN